MSASSSKLVLSPERCDSCGKCLRVCPTGLIRIGGGYIYVDSSGCSGCLLCADVCDRGAIARREIPLRPTTAAVLKPAEVPKVAVGSRAEAKALRTLAEQAERDRAEARKASEKHAKQVSAIRQHAETVAADGTAAWTLADAGIAVAALVAGLVLKELALGSRVVAVMPASGQALARAVVLAGFYALQLAALVVLAHRHGLTVAGAFGLRGLGRSAAHRATSAALVVALLVATRAAALLWGVLSSAVGWGPPVRGELTGVFGAGGGGLALSVLMVVLVGPFVEELVFRGVVLGAAGPRWGMWPAIAGSAVLFALAHLTAWAFVPTLVLGCALGWLAWTRGSLWPAIALHALYNGLVVSAAFWLAR